MITKFEKFLNYLAELYNHRVKLEIRNQREKAFYLPIKNTIYLSKELVEETSIEEILWILAHEYKHSLINLSKDNFVENYYIVSKYIPYILIFIGNIFLLHFFDQKEIIYYVLLSLFGLPLVILANNPFWYNEIIFAREKECNKFADELVGTGSIFFEKLLKKSSMDEKRFKLVQNILTLGMYSPTHPSLSECLEDSKKYSPNIELLNKFK